MIRVRQATDFGRVAVLYGGESSEREVSLDTGQAVLNALLERGVDATGIDTREMPVAELAGAGFDRAWLALHGRGYEDGTVAGALELIGLPYTGSGVLGSALAMDKVRSKMLFAAVGLATPRWTLLRDESALADAPRQVGFPCVVKPAAEGSSVGVHIVQDTDGLAAAWHAARECDANVIVEHCVEGPEYTAGVLGSDVLPLIRIETPRTFYDYRAKYHSDNTTYHCPCGLKESRERELAALARRAFDVVGASGWGRVDFMLDDDGTAWFLEVNTIPGMTSHSLVPMAARQAGIDFPELVWRVLETSMERAS